MAQLTTKAQVVAMTETSLIRCDAVNFRKSQSVCPEYIRLPKCGTLCPWTGLSRSKLNELILPSRTNGHCPPVRSLSLRKRNQVKAVRLISFDSLLSHLRSLETHSGRSTTNEAPGNLQSA